MRLHLLVNNKHYYDVGLRKGNNLLSKTHRMFGEEWPRYLEDYIQKYNKRNITILDYGNLSLEDVDYVLKVMKE